MKKESKSVDDKYVAVSRILSELDKADEPSKDSKDSKWVKREDRLKARYPVLQILDISTHYISYKGQEWVDSIVALINHSEVFHKQNH